MAKKLLAQLPLLYIIAIISLSGCDIPQEHSLEYSIQCTSFEKSESLYDISDSDDRNGVPRLEDYYPEYDMPQGYSRFARTMEYNDVIYFAPVMDHFVRYYDRVSGTGGILCGKPECSHDSETCNAFIFSSFVAYYDGWLYFSDISQNEDPLFTKNFPYGLYRMNLQGTERSYVQDLYGDLSGNAFVAIHRGYIYMGNLINGIENGAYKGKIQFIRQKIGDADAAPEILFEEEVAEAGVDFQCQLAGNHMYLLIRKYNVTEYVEYERVFLYDYNIWTGQGKLCAEDLYEDGFYLTGFGVANHVPFYVRTDSRYSRNDIMIYAFSDEKDCFVLSGECHPPEDRFYYPYAGDGVVIAGGKALNESEMENCIFDLQGRLLQKIIVPYTEELLENKDVLGVTIITGSTEHLLIAFETSIPSENGRSLSYNLLTEIRFEQGKEAQIQNLMEYISE